MAGALKNTDELEVVVLSYDQCCKYSIHFEERMEKQFPHLKGSFVKMTYLVNKAHLIGHNPDCQVLFNPNYTEGSGRGDGESNERNWGILNANAVTTKEMTPGHRRDALNDCLNYHNWLKAINLGKGFSLSLRWCHN